MVGSLEETLQNPAVVPAPGLPPDIMLLRLIAAFGLGWLAVGIYWVTCRRQRDDVTTDFPFLATIVLLAPLIALVTLVVGSNIALAFSLVGTLAIVRFRTVVDDTRDTTFVIYSVVAGMAAGSGYLFAPLACAPMVCFAAWIFRPRVGETDRPRGKLTLRLAAGRERDEKLNDLLRVFVGDARLIGLTTARGGAAFDAVYAVKLPAADKIFALIAELNRIEGIQSAEIREE